MRQQLIALTALLFISVSAYMSGGCRHKGVDHPGTIAKDIALKDIDTLKAYLLDSLLVSVESNAPATVLQQQFKRTRILFKRTEWITEYFMPGITRFVNGAPLPEIEVAENKVTDPEGLQVMEGLLFPDTINKQEIIRQIKFIHASCMTYSSYLEEINITPAQIFDACRLEIFRVITLGITGFDAPLAKSSIPEASECIRTISRILQTFGEDPALSRSGIDAARYLDNNTDFDTFDRLTFIRSFADPLSISIAARQKALEIPFVRTGRLLKPEAATLFQADAFDINAYTPDSSYYLTTEKADLGKQLFYNNLLSGNNSRSCASCHQPDKAFTDGLTRSSTLDGKSFIRRNTPTLLNAALQPSLFYDLRATILENQALSVVNNSDEMHGSMTDAAAALWQDKTYRQLFMKVFKDAESGIKPIHIQQALASYIRSLVKLNSRFDDYMQGDTTALSGEEKNGFNLFSGKAKCGTCHFMPLFNGTVPPAFLKIETEVIGVPDASGKQIDADSGRYDMYQLLPFRHAFKTSTVRNSALTAPYMHNGVFKTLEEVVDFYNKGAGTGLGYDVDNQTLPFDRLNLSLAEERAIVSFMRTLTSK